MDGSIFSGLSPGSLLAVIEAAKHSPEALGALAIVAAAAVAALAFAGAMTAHHLGGFHARIEREDALAREEEEREAHEARRIRSGAEPENEETSERESS